MQLKLQIKRNYLNSHWSLTVALLVRGRVVSSHAFPTETGPVSASAFLLILFLCSFFICAEEI